MVKKMTRRAFLALSAGVAGVVASARALGHHKPGHTPGPKPSPGPSPSPSPSPTVTTPPPSGGVGPLMGAQWVRDHTTPGAVVAPAGVVFTSAADLQAKVNADPNRVFVAEPGEIDWDRAVEI
jgi:Predicted solute binding protein